MTDGALYNEIEPFAADWLENLIAAGKIAPGVVDRRSIVDLDPDYVRRFRQVHLFAGIGIWSAALRGAGWPEDRRILTGSCPCQPFSSAGQGAGFDDERHLWPAMFQLAVQCDFDVILGEQVASKDGLEWVDLVRADLEGAGYAFAAFDLCAAGFGTPHIRQRLNWTAVRAEGVGLAGGDERDGRDAGRPQAAGHAGVGGGSGGLADAVRRGAEPAAGNGDGAQGTPLGDDGGSSRPGAPVGERLASSGLADANRENSGGRGILGPRQSLGVGDGTACERPSGLCETGGRILGRLANPSSEPGPQECASVDAQHGERSAYGRGPIVPAGLGANGGDCGRDYSAGSGGVGPTRDMAPISRPGPVNGAWRAADWLYCRDGRWRPVEPGTFPLAHALPKSMGTMGAGLSGLVNMAGLDKRSLAAAKRFRTGTLRGFGNAVVYEQTEAFCAAVMETIDHG